MQSFAVDHTPGRKRVDKAHHNNGELYSVTFKRDSVTISSYENDAIRTSLETWADTVAILA